MLLRKQRLFRIALILLFVSPIYISKAATAQVSALTESPAVALALAREHDPVIVKGLFPGAAAEEIYVYRFLAGTWELIPHQVDLVDDEGAYLPDVTGTLDDNDEIVFMASDLGELPAEPITNSVNIQGPWYQVEVTDPLAPQDKGYAYVVRSSSPLGDAGVDHIDFDMATLRATSDIYSVGWAEDHSGMSFISLAGSGNILDRTKLRINYRIGSGAPQEITEEGNAIIPVSDVELIKDGPVRIIVKRASVLTFGYHSLLRTVLEVDLSNIPLLIIENVRSSTDLANTVSGTYYNQNIEAGVTIDGAPDSVAETPFNQAWRQISLSSGAMIQVTDLSSVGGFPRHYYKDDATVDVEDTGDGQSYGDSGFLVISPSGKAFTLDSNVYFLSGSQDNRGSEFFNLYQNPLVTAITEQGQPPPPPDKENIFLPFARKD